MANINDPKMNEPSGRILSASPFLVCLYRRIIFRYFMLGSEKYDDARSISM
jgi:hypothetical protein